MTTSARSRWSFAVCCLFTCGTTFAQETKLPKADPPKSALKNLVIYPTDVKLDGPRDEQRLGVLGEFAEGRSWDLSRAAKYNSSDAKVASVDATGLVQPVGDGKATITIQASGQTKTIPV